MITSKKKYTGRQITNMLTNVLKNYTVRNVLEEIVWDILAMEMLLKYS